MAWVILLVAQAALVAPDAAAFDLRATTPATNCGSGGEEIVVCGKKHEDESFRLRALPSDVYEPRPLRAQIGIGNGTAGVEGEQQSFGNGSVSKRVMVKMKFKF